VTLPTFSELFHALHGFDPFPWQARLADRVLEACARGEVSPWPRLLDLPTGAGKTSALDVALYTLACAPTRLPRRTVLVVDRRIVVDQAGDHARSLARKLAEAEHGPVRAIADALRALWGAGPSDDPIAVGVMRGGMPRDDDWARRPDQPMLGVSTVDQVGSRLLFRGYGVSARTASIHAGLVGNDTLVLLDEVHLAEPFAQTLDAIERARGDEGSLPRRFGVVRMSATPGRAEAAAFRLDQVDRDHALLGRRLRARKAVRLEPVRVTGDDEAKKLTVVAQAAVGHALALQRAGARVVGIVLNRVDSARHARALLEAHASTNALLVTGRMRPIDRDRLVQEDLLPRCGPRGRRGEDARPLVVVATQCIEAGADLDFDALVTECASLDALRQRFGRLDRQGALGETKAVVLARTDQIDPGKRDPVYGEALGATWRWLHEQAASGELDFGIERLPAAVDEDGVPRVDLLAPRPDAPVLLPAHLDAWAQTSPVPDYDPDVSLWLHGPDKPLLDVQVLWREDLVIPSPEAAEEHVAEALRAAVEALGAARPSSLETMSVPTRAVRRWLAGGSSVPVADVLAGDASEEEEGRRRAPSETLVALRWRGEDSEWVRADDVRPGDVVIVPASRGGIRHGSFDPAHDAPVQDVGSVASLRARGQVSLRLDGAGAAALGLWPEDVRGLVPTEEESTRAWRERVRDWARTLPEARPLVEGSLEATSLLSEAEWSALRRVLSGRQAGRLVHHGPEGKGMTWQATVPRSWLRTEVGEAISEDDGSSFTAGAVTLAAHSEDVRELARRFAQSVSFPEALVEDLALAAWLHDVGKADPRFQRWLAGGSEVRAALSETPLAKSALPSGSLADRMLARERAGYPAGYRHELLSLAMVEASTALGGAHDVDLVLHLVASHHGYCRPFAPFEDHPDDLTVTLEHGEHALAAGTRHRRARLDSGVAERFWRLVDRYGWWGLAWLEAVLRLADHRASERAQGDGDVG
jgi:CRISPR-associated endonuclease/helicase Cas3